jgi:hypothetical protein
MLKLTTTPAKSGRRKVDPTLAPLEMADFGHTFAISLITEDLDGRRKNEPVQKDELI